MIEIGGRAPAFTLPDENGDPVKLGDFEGRWLVLYFYPKDDTPGCTTEACEFTEGVARLGSLDAVVLGCSPDSPASHREFIAKYGLGIKLLSDPEHKVMEEYAAWGEKTLYGRKSVGVKRSTVIIDPTGRIAHHWKSVSAEGHAAKVAERLAKLQK